MAEYSIEINGLEKSYGAVKAVRGASFYVEKGALFALLGENGAGKSTTIDVLSTLLKPDKGTVHINGHTLGQDDAAIRQKIGIVFQQSVLDDLLTVRENLMVRGGFYGFSHAELKQRIHDLCAPLGIDEFLNRRYGKLSGGQRRRADIARALLNRPDILYLDEPTTGLDPASRQAIWSLVQNLQRSSGTTVLLTTHYMEEAARADYVVVMGHGKVLGRGTPHELKNTYARDALHIEPLNMEEMLRTLRQDGVTPAHANGRIHIELASTTDALPLLARYGTGIKNFEVAAGSMDEAFLNIIQSDTERGAQE